MSVLVAAVPGLDMALGEALGPRPGPGLGPVAALTLGPRLGPGLGTTLGPGRGEALGPLVSVALGLGWALVVAASVAAHARGRRARRPQALIDRPRAQAGRADAGAPGPPWRVGGPTTTRPGAVAAISAAAVGRLGAAVRRLMASALPAGAGATGADARPGTALPRRTVVPDVGRPPASRRRGQSDTAADRRTGGAARASLGLLFVAPPLAAAPLGWAVAAPVVAARRERARHEARLHDQLPDVVDLVALTTGAGLPVAASLLAIGDRPGGPLGTALAHAGAHLRHGGTTGEALDLLAAAGPAARPLVDALAQHDRYGTPLLPALDRVAVEARARRRRRSEEAARRLPVTLLFPLVLTTFPAFVLLTVVPLLAGSLGSLSLTTR
ncbi:MAG TPA: type II secretion system F family protein [Acidimicrobiales bacterium]|nr:type II secretion system F family protein [Acidimicrobiales bacterium]